jgi:hypothetical protein
MDGKLMAMETVYRGLAAPRQVVAMGRDDIAPAERPGAALAGLARDALAAGEFPAAPAPSADPEPASVRVRDYAVSDVGHDDGFEEGIDLDEPSDERGFEGDEGLDA